MEIFKHCRPKTTPRNEIFTVAPINEIFNDKKRDNGENILKIYLQFGYYLRILPFKISENKADGTICLDSNKLQKVRISQLLSTFTKSLKLSLKIQIICGIGHFLSLFLLVRKVNVSLIYGRVNTKVHPRYYFDIFDSWAYIVSKFLIIKSLWVHKTTFLKILRLLGNSDSFEHVTYKNPV